MSNNKLFLKKITENYTSTVYLHCTVFCVLKLIIVLIVSWLYDYKCVKKNNIPTVVYFNFYFIAF